MLFIANAQGTILNTVPDRVYQGSNNANQVLLAIPLPSSVTIKVAYKLPNGLLTEPALMTYNEQEVEGNPLNVWSIDIPEAITTYYGTVTTQFVATNSQGVKVASGSATFEVERGVAPVLPATPTQQPEVKVFSLKRLFNIFLSIFASNRTDFPSFAIST